MINLKRLLTIGVILLVAVVLGGAAPPEEPLTAGEAEAVVERIFLSDDPVAAYESLTPAEREGFRKFTTTTVVYSDGSDEDDVLASAVDCDTNTKYAHRRNLYGMNVATYKSWTFFCWENYEVVSANFKTRGWGNVYGWSWRGNLYAYDNYGPNNYYHRDYAQGDFQFCLPIPFVPCVYWTPIIEKIQWGDGDYS